MYGPDVYRLQQTKQNIIKEYRKKHSSGVNIFDFDLSDAGNLARLLDTVKSSSFFNEHKLVALSNTFSKKVVADEVGEMIGVHNIVSAFDITLMLTEPSNEKDLATKSNVLFKLVTDKQNMVKNFNPLDGTRLAQWVQEEFKFRNCSIDHRALNKLIDAIGNDSWALTNEIDKLTAYAGEREIGIADIDLLVNQSKELNIFELINAIGSRNNKKAFELLYCELKTGRDPYYLLTMAAYQFRNLIVVKDLQRQKYSESDIATKTKMHPFVIKKAARSPFQFEEVAQIYGRLLSIDNGFKLGKLNLEDSLYTLVTA